MQCPSCQSSVDGSPRFCPACGASLSAQPTDVPQDVLLGQTLGGKYRVIRLLGEGGMGAVYEGEQKLGTTKRKVAIKTLHPHLSRDANIKARFEREVGTVAELEHPNTIQVHDFGATDDGILYIVMEFLHGQSLARTLEGGGAMTPERVDHIIEQVCGSLEEAHGRGIVHRDLKPDNVVLLDRAGKKDFVKVLDFGIAKRSHEEDRNEQKLTQQGTVLGTPPYMSPEQFTGRPIDARSDIYSLGVMAYEMLTGRLPFQANTAWEWATQHMTQPPFPIESLAEGMRAPEPMRAAIMRSLAKNPDDRFQTVQEFGQAFAAKSAPGPRLTPPTEAMGLQQKTEVGAPVDFSAAFHGPGPAAGPATAGRTPTTGGSQVAFAGPATIPQPPPRTSGGSASRALLLGAATVIALASAGAIVFAMRGKSAGPSAGSTLGADTSAPAASISPVDTSTPAPSSPADSTNGSDVPPLNTGGGGGVHPIVPHTAPPHTTPSTPTAQPIAPPPNPIAPATTSPPLPAPPAPPAPRPARYEGIECQRARQLRAFGHPREAESWALLCTAKGGMP